MIWVRFISKKMLKSTSAKCRREMPILLGIAASQLQYSFYWWTNFTKFSLSSRLIAPVVLLHRSAGWRKRSRRKIRIVHVEPGRRKNLCSQIGVLLPLRTLRPLEVLVDCAVCWLTLPSIRNNLGQIYHCFDFEMAAEHEQSESFCVYRSLLVDVDLSSKKKFEINELI